MSKVAVLPKRKIQRNELDSVYRKLTQEELQMLRTKKWTFASTPKELLEKLQGLAFYDKQRDIQQDLITAYATSGSVSAIRLLGVIAVILLFVVSFSVPPLFIVFFLVLIALILYWRRYSWIDKYPDIPNVFRLFVAPLLAVCQEEMRPDEPVNLELNLERKTDKKYFKEKVPDNAKGYPKITTTYFTFPLMNFSAKFGDGVRLLITIEDEIREKYIQKKTYRGKYKTKTKHKTKAEYYVKASFPKTIYQLKNSETPKVIHNDEIVICYEEEEKYIVFKYKSKNVCDNIYYVPEFNNFLSHISHLYSLVQPIGK